MIAGNKKFLFVCGIQRSGTTALANILNWHCEISVCIERYKNLMFGRAFKQFEPELFEKHKLLDFSNDYTNCTPSKSERFANFYENLEQKYDGLKYIGDKVPNSYKKAPRIYRKFSDMKFIFIVRDIEDTACSWQSRADNVTDGWPSTKTAEKAIDHWNNCNKTILDLHAKHPDDVYVVDYKDFFNGDPEITESFDSILRFLDVKPDEGASAAFTNARIYYQERVKNKDRHLPSETMRYISDHADLDTYQHVQEIARNNKILTVSKAA